MLIVDMHTVDVLSHIIGHYNSNNLGAEIVRYKRPASNVANGYCPLARSGGAAAMRVWRATQSLLWCC